MRVYEICASIEACLIQIVAVIDLTNLFICTFYRAVLNKRLRLADMADMMRKDKIELSWIARLKFFRRVIVHAYTGWPYFEQVKNQFVITIKFPKSIQKMKEYALLKKDSINSMELNELFECFNQYIIEVPNWLLSKINRP